MKTNPVAALTGLIALAGPALWAKRIAELKRDCTPSHAGRALWQRHALELSIDRLRGTANPQSWSTAEQRVVALCESCVGLSAALPAAGRTRLAQMLRDGLRGSATLVPLFHLLHTAAMQRHCGFAVSFTGFSDATAYDLLIARDGAEAEVTCAVMSAETGRDVHRHAWSQLVDRVDPDLQSWLAAHPGRYLLKMTLPQGLRHESCVESTERLASLHQRITRMLAEQRRADHDEAAVMRLDPLVLAAAQAADSGLMLQLRREFGPEAHLAVTGAGSGVFVLAARASREDDIAVALHRNMAEIAPRRFSGERPGILAMFIEDTDRLEWRQLHDQLRLEGEARQFLTRPEARAVVAVTCTSRVELLAAEAPRPPGMAGMRFRNPSHPACRQAALAPAIAPPPAPSPAAS